MDDDVEVLTVVVTKQDIEDNLQLELNEIDDILLVSNKKIDNEEE